MREKLFFLASKAAARRLTQIFDFVWPTAAAIWNLRWQVCGYVATVPDVSEEELQGRFTLGSGIRGANLRRACIENTWEEQEQEFSRFLLLEFCALYEAWCENILEDLNPSAVSAKSLQFPTTFLNGVAVKGIGYALQAIGASSSAIMSGSFYSVLQKNRKYSGLQLEELFVCYRYFKELRNILVHNSGAISQSFLDAETAYLSLTARSLDVKEKPEMLTQSQTNDVAVSLRGVVGFGDIVLKIICTLDAELATSQAAESSLQVRWEQAYGRTPLALPLGPRR